MSETDLHGRPPAVRERPTWLSYAQAGDLLGLSPEAVRHRARRNSWRTQPGNDGRTLVMIPDEDVAVASSRPPVHTADRAPVRTPDHEAEIARAHARAERADERADEAAKRADVALALADRTLSQLADVTARMDQERQRADTLHQGLAVAEMAITELRVDLEAARQQAEAAEIARAEAAVGVTEARDRRDEALRQAEAAEMQAEADRSVVERLQLEHAAADAIAAEAVRTAEQFLQVDAARKGRGRLARLRAAWRGE